MVLRMEMRWAEKRGFEVELLEVSPGEEAGHQVGDVPGQGRERLRALRQREGRPPARAALAVRRRPPAPDELRRRRGLAGRRGDRRGRDRRRRPADRHLPGQRRRRPARQQDRLGGADHPPADRDRRAVPERALAVLQQGRRRWRCCARSCVELEERQRREEIARERGEAQDVNFGSQIRSYVLHPYTMVKDHRTDFEMGDANRVLDGDLDGFVRAYLLKQPRPTRAPGRAAPMSRRPPSSRRARTWRRSPPTASAARPASTSPATRAARAPTRACAARSATARCCSTSRRTSRGSTSAPRRPPTSAPSSLAAEAYGAGRTWFLTNGATQGNHALCLALAPPGRRRSCCSATRHASLIDGLVLSGGRASWVAPEYDAELGMAHGVTPEALAAALARGARTPGAAFIVSPTYYGMAADVGACAEVAHAAGAALVVDNAWGSHFGFHPALPELAAARSGADAMIASTHKIVGSLTQSAMLLVAPRRPGRRRRGRPRGAPGALDEPELAADGLARRRPPPARGPRRGAAGADARPRSARARAAIDAVPGCAVVGGELVGRPGIAGWDPLRIVIDVRGTGCTGYEVAAALRATYDIYVELATHATLVLVVGLAQPVEPLERLAHDFAETVRRISRPGRAPAVARAAGGARARDRGRAPRGVPRAPARRCRSTRRSAGSRASRSPATRPACRRCCPASG